MNPRFRFAKLARREGGTTLARYAPFWEEIRFRAFFGMAKALARKFAEKGRRACRFYEYYGDRASGKEARDAWERELYGEGA